jgi:hypothetical protein
VQIIHESPAQKEKFRLAAHRLLNHCFLLKKKEETRADYIFVLQHRESFREFFDLLGYRLDINETFGIVALISLYGTGRLRLKKIESMIVLLLRLLYIEKSKQLRLSDEVVVLTEELQEKYALLKIESKPQLDKTVTRDSLRLLRRYHLIDLPDRDPAQPDARIKIYPSILFAVPNERIQQSLDALHSATHDKLNLYRNGGEADDEERDEETMPDTAH